MDRNGSALQRYMAYSKERFPLPGVLLYAGTLSSVCYLFPRTLGEAARFSWSSSLLCFVVLVLVFFHLRVLDEHKDYDKDRIAYPERLLSRGVVTLGGLRKLMAAALAIEAGISLYLGTTQTAIWLVILAWSLLMYKEFFVAEWLNSHLGIYLVTHQLLIPIMGLYAVNQALPVAEMSTQQRVSTALLLGGVMCLTITYEIARKTWSHDRENEHADSYTKVWGIRPTVIATDAIALLGVALLLSLPVQTAFRTGQVVISAGLFGLLLAGHAAFVHKPVRKASKLVETAGALCMLGVFCASAVAFGLS